MATQKELGAHLDLSDRSIRELLDKGVLPNARRGAFNVDQCRVAYIRHLREMAAGRAAGPSADDLTLERARLASEQANNVAMKNAAMRRDLLPRVEITLAVTGAFKLVRDRLIALPGRLAGTLALLSEPGEVRARLAEAVNDVLMELAEETIIPAREEEEGEDAT